MIKVYLNNYLCDHSSIYHNQYLYNIVYISLYIYNLYFWYTIVLYITFYVGQLVQKKTARLFSQVPRCDKTGVFKPPLQREWRMGFVGERYMGKFSNI